MSGTLEAMRLFRKGQRVRMTPQCPRNKDGTLRTGMVVGFSRTGGIRVVLDGNAPTSANVYALRFWEPVAQEEPAGPLPERKT